MPIRVVNARLDIRADDDDSRRRQPILYFWFKGETILDHLVNRHHEPYMAVQPLLPEILASLGVECPPEAIYWRQKAGCSCGCSPGFILPGATVNGQRQPYGFDIFVDLTVEDAPAPVAHPDMVMCG